MKKTTEAAMLFDEKIAYLQEIKAHIKSLQEEQKEIETNIKDIIKDNLGIKTPKYVIVWKTQRKSSVDTKSLCENEPNIYAKYERVTTFRTMRISKNKENEVA